MFGWGIKSITTTQLAERLDTGKPTLIDVREPYEYEAGHVPGAVNIPLGTLQQRMAKLDASAPVYVICQSGHRSSNAVRLLKRAGFKEAINVQGGTSAWRGRLAK